MSKFAFANAKLTFETENTPFSANRSASKSVRMRSIAEKEQLKRQIV